VAVAADKAGSAIDLKGFGSAMVVLEVGVVTDGAYAFELQESDTTTAGDFTAVAAGDLIGTEPTGIDSDHDGTVHVLGYKGNKRYIRYSITETTPGTTGGVMSVLVVKGQPWSKPVG
jgi:hypothetical protein